MTDLFDRDQTIRTDILTELAAQISDRTVDRKALNAAATTIYGGTNASGAWTQRDSFELLEQALTIHLRELPPIQTFEAIAPLCDLVDALPTHTVRSEEQLQYQQFSTPADLAALMVLLARPRADDIVLEPSAGNGSLLATLPAVKSLHLNELNDRRREGLTMLFPDASITGHDAALLTSHLSASLSPTLILMNPPFSRSEGKGADRYAAVRHLRSAIAKAAPGARIAAIMPDWFTTSSAMGRIYDETLEGCSVRNSVALEKCYHKQGTSVAVRLYVIDKRPGNIRPSVLARRTVRDLLSELKLTARGDITTPTTAPKAPSPSKKPSLFRAMRTKTVVAPPVIRAKAKNEVLPVIYKPLTDPRPLGDQVGVYLPYRPSRIDLANSGTHPTALVESVAMGSIPGPIPDYVPILHERIVNELVLSEAQLETLVYAGSAWEQFLPGTMKPAENGVGLELADDGDTYRKGYFLGDGTGAGKGRQIAGCILDNWLNGRRKNIWVSKNRQLLEDARRDWEALGGLSADVQPLSNWKIDQPIGMSEGILFVTYPTLRSARQDATRLQQILDWATPTYEGVIAFDESHEMGGVAGGEGAMGRKNGSQQGVAGVLLQNNLPKARVLYASATGASEVNNLAYAVRLGLWGPHTAFPSREQFISEIRDGGIAAMELVCRDLKAQGLYQARALSFAGVEYEILKHALTKEQITVYGEYSSAWSIINRNMERVLELTNVVDEIEGDTLNSGAKAAARSRFESSRQRFFNQVLLSMKLPTIIDAIDHHRAQGQSAVIQLVTTAESILDRRLGALSPDERANLEIELSPIDNVIDYLDRAFPTQQMRIFTDDTGKECSMPLYDDAGNPVHNQEAIAAKNALMEQICAMPPIKSALDAIIEHYGTDEVAEVTGRSKRLVTQSDGSQKLESRSPRTNQAEAASFMDGRKRILIFSDAGGTGRSYHASLDVNNQERRVHFLLEPGWRADRAIQGLGRTHRTHQATTPLFRPCTTDCKGELRFTSTIARRLDSLGALTRGQRQTGGQNLFDPADNLESEYARAALVTWFHLLGDGKLTSTTMLEFEELSGLKLTEEGGVLVEDLPPIQRWLNRILALPIAMQNLIFDEFLSLVETRVDAAREAGTLDIGVETIAVENAKVIEDIVLRTDSRTKATSHLLTIEIAKRLKPVSCERIFAIADECEKPRFMRNAKSGRVALAEHARSLMQDSGEMLKRILLTRPTRREYKLVEELAESAWESCSRTEFEAAWREEADEAVSRTITERLYIATGLLLPIWSAFPKDYLAVRRIVDDAGASWLGRLVDESDVPALLKTFAISSEVVMSGDGVMDVLNRRNTVTIERPWPMTIKRSLVNKDQRIEIVGDNASHLTWLKSLGCFTEIIAYKTRVFVPADRADTIVGAIMETA